MIEDIAEQCGKAIEHRVFPGCAVGILAGGKRWTRAFGRYTYEPGASEVREDTIYDVASITKAVPVAILALKLIGEGSLHLDEPLIAVIPEFSGVYRESITMLHLLTHTLDFGFQLSACKELGSSTILEKILSAPLRSPPGTTFSYANATSILLGLVIERKTGLLLETAAQQLLFEPLGMRRTTFFPERFDRREVVPSEFDAWRGRLVHAEVHDESAFALRPKVVGSAGLFSTAPDLLTIAEMVLADGVLKGTGMLTPHAIMLMGTNICPAAAGACAGAGWELNQPSFMGAKCGPATFGKTGFTGCSMVIDTVRRAAVVLLSNHVYPHRQPDRSKINEVRRGLADTVFSVCPETTISGH